MHRSPSEKTAASVRRLAAMAQLGESPGAIEATLAQELKESLAADQVHMIQLDEAGATTQVATMTEEGTEHWPVAAGPQAAAIALVAAPGRPAVVSNARRVGALPTELVTRFSIATAA